jgi:hypothetical protein
MKRSSLCILIGAALVVLAGCGTQGPACPKGTGTPRYLDVPPDELPSPPPGLSPTAVIMKIKGQKVSVDKVVSGPLCNDTWSGTVYVSCDVQIYPWTDSPTFLKNCNLNIEPGTIIFVAYHNDTAYYNGCSCHTGELATPTLNP